jgi:hypothetical protein
LTELFCGNEKKSSCVSQLQYLIPVEKNYLVKENRQLIVFLEIRNHLISLT